MARGIANKKLSKKTNYKDTFKKFINSGYTDLNAFKQACKHDENLLIYTCIKQEELLPYIETLKQLPTLGAQIAYLKDAQPFMNETEERFDKCVKCLAEYLSGYITYNGFLMNNNDGDVDDWTNEFYLKYIKITNFYRTRWFHKDKLKKESTVQYNKMHLKEFVYICRMSITGERRHQAFLATQKPDTSLFKSSLDFKLDQKQNSKKTLGDVVQDPMNSHEYCTDNTNLLEIQKKALALSKEYEGGIYTKALEEYYRNQIVNSSDRLLLSAVADPSWLKYPRKRKEAENFVKSIVKNLAAEGVILEADKEVIKNEKKIVDLAKVFLYKAGLVSPRMLSFIRGLSSTSKINYNINPAVVSKQSQMFKTKHKIKQPSYADILEDGGKTRIGLVLRKRGTL